MFLKGTCTLVLASALLAACGSSATTWSTQGTDVAPGADAKVRLAEKEQNYELKLQVDHLLPPSRAAQGAQTYAVWLQPRGQEQPFHIGNLQYDDGKRTGELTTMTPFNSFDVFVTAEPTMTPMEPQGPTVVSETVEQR
jgi:hypothetical protein